MTMFIETVYSDGLAHLSYIIGHNGRAAVIDPRRDCEVYMDIARRQGAAITHIFETHRNEDYVIGSVGLAKRTGAEIHHGAATDFAYGHAVRQGDTFAIGGLELRVLETPGHTYDSISIAFADTTFGDEALGVFTGDALFIGDVGRTDFFPEKKQEVAELLYHSIHDTLLPLGDQVILYPAHGAGSVCGGGMAPRNFSTLGYERMTNPLLQLSKEEFIEKKVQEEHMLPGYFKKMEEYNQLGNAPDMCCSPTPMPLDAETFGAKMDAGMAAVDVRTAEAISGAFIPGSWAFPLEVLSGYVGFFMPYGKEIGLIAEDPEQVEEATRQLLRMGYDTVSCYLHQNLHNWETSGKRYETIPAVHSGQLTDRITSGEDFILLDVRKAGEVKAGKLQGATHIFLGDLQDRLGELPKDKTVTTFCGSGVRAIVGASILKRNGFEDVEVALGSMAACQSFGCPLDE